MSQFLSRRNYFVPYTEIYFRLQGTIDTFFVDDPFHLLGSSDPGTIDF